MFLITAYVEQPFHLLNLGYEQKDLLASLLRWCGMPLKEAYIVLGWMDSQHHL